MLKLVQEATTFPWPNLTKAMTEEMRFNGMARLFPPAEGLALLEAYAAELPRLYETIDEGWLPLYFAVLKQNCIFNMDQRCMEDDEPWDDDTEE